MNQTESSLGVYAVRSGAAVLFVCLMALLSPVRAQSQPKTSAAPPRSFAESLRHHRAFDLSTWQNSADLEQLRFGLLHTSELFPTARIGRGGSVAALRAEPMRGIGGVAIGHAGGPTFDEYLGGSRVDGFIVVHMGVVVYERYPRMAPSDKHLYWSVSKTLISAAIGILEDEGRIDTQQPIEVYIPELADTEWRGTAVLDILDMASGMDALEDDGDPFDPTSPYFSFESSLGILPPANSALTTNVSTYDYVAGLKRLRRAGWIREYTSVNSFVLSWLIERVTGQPYAQVISDRIWQRIGAEADAGIIVAAGTGAPSSHGGVFSTLRDLARYGLIYTPSWRAVASAPVVSPAYVRRVQTGGRAALLENRRAVYPTETPDPTESGGRDMRAVYVSTHQWDHVWEDGDFFKAGFQGQGLYVSPARDLVIAGFSSGEPSPTAREFRALATSGLFRN